jgi:hypothetical protein
MPILNLYGYEVETAGWGKTSVNSFSRYLQTVSLKVLEKEECKNQIEAISNQPSDIPNTFLCTVANPFAFLRNVSISLVVLTLITKIKNEWKKLLSN